LRGDERMDRRFASCPALCRASTSLRLRKKQDVDGRDKPGHDNSSGWQFTVHPREGGDQV
jgi:hypothetical protein